MGKYLDATGLEHLIGKIKTALSGKQATLVSGTNIKTVNNQSLLGSGNISVSGGGTDINQYIEDYGPLTYTENNEWSTNILAIDYGGTGVDGTNSGLNAGEFLASSPTAVSPMDIGFRRIVASDIPSLAISKITNLQTTLDGKSDDGHTHAAGDVTSGTFAAARIPSLAISKITNLQTTLDGKQPAGDYWSGDKGSTNYWGLVNPEGASTGWVRTPASGLLPAASGGGSSSLGTSGWPFTNLYATNIYHNGTKLGSAATHNDSDYADATHYHTGVRSSDSVDALHRMYLTTSKNIRIDERASASDSFALYGYAAVSSQAPSDSGYKTANHVLATPNGSAGLPTMRALVANDIPRLNADKINLNGYSWVTGTTPTAIGFSATAYTSVATSGWTYYKFLANGGSMYVYHAFGVVKFKNTAITTAHGSGYINSANLYIRLPVKARVIKSATFGTTMGGGLLGVTLLAAGGTGDWKSTTDSLINLPVRLFSPVSQAAANSNNDNQFIPVDIWFTAAA